MHPGKYIITSIGLIVRSGLVFSTFFNVDFQKNYTEDNDVRAQKIYEFKTSIGHSWNSLRTQQAKQSDTPSLQNSLPSQIQQTLRDSIPASDTKQYATSNTLSFDEIIQSITPHDLDQDDGYESIQQLLENYKASQDPNLALVLIKELTKQYNYNKAYEIFQQLDSRTIKLLDPHLTLLVLFNSELITKNDFSSIENVIAEFKANDLLTIKDAQRYEALLLLLKHQKQEFIAALPVYTPQDQSSLAALVEDLRLKISQSTQGHDIPGYYSDGMIALGMFQYGYPLIAQKLSIDLLVDYPQYILPKQILAYSHVILHERNKAQSYFLQLIENDNKNINTYQFFAGICSYRLGKYTDAILYLNQLGPQYLISDATRYKILSYIALEDRTNVAKQFKILLDSPHLTNSDMLLAREQFVFESHMRSESSPILRYDNNLLGLYINRCNPQDNDPLLCQIGKLAQQVSIRQVTLSESELKNLVRSFPRSYMYYILGEYYQQHGDTMNAQKSFVSALALSSDPDVKNNITLKIKSLL